jgi:hypothetical protein
VIEREWKQDSVQREFWRDHGYCRFYLYFPPPLSPIRAYADMPDTVTTPIAFAQYDRETGFINVTTTLDHSYKWLIPVLFSPWGMIRTPLLNPANRGRY